ncbi:hypothetical protein AV530_003555 [Patagioenas fasciata monilis]|uniref:Uncharacterized protein n=1 Tax=Patagioenas fasciata monilis TaxID=372326 RepID=A0A1V4K353_PATFA|nr:hypothetical protein AV530_003555 [Patagioenas fasciata monilis]
MYLGKTDREGGTFTKQSTPLVSNRHPCQNKQQKEKCACITNLTFTHHALLLGREVFPGCLHLSWAHVPTCPGTRFPSIHLPELSSKSWVSMTVSLKGRTCCWCEFVGCTRKPSLELYTSMVDHRATFRKKASCGDLEEDEKFSVMTLGSRRAIQPPEDCFQTQGLNRQALLSQHHLHPQIPFRCAHRKESVLPFQRKNYPQPKHLVPGAKEGW